MKLIERCRALWDWIKREQARPPARAFIPRDRVRPPKDSTHIEPGKHYFQVRINELFLKDKRRWTRDYDPMVVVLSEFNYDRQTEALPFVVGPALLEKAGISEIPDGMVFANTRVAGLHPYRGGRLSITVVLCSVERQAYAQKLLGTIEGAASALDFSASLGTYLKVGKVVMEGIEGLLGFKENKPLVGVRCEIDPDAGDALGNGYHVLIHAPENAVDLARLWVVNGQLHTKDDSGKLVPFRAADYVLYSIAGAEARTDLSTLPFYDLWERVRGEAALPTEEGWKSAKANMVSLYQQMLTSPDLTHGHAQVLAGQFVEEMQQIRQKARQMASLESATESDEDARLDELGEARAASVALLDG